MKKNPPTVHEVREYYHCNEVASLPKLKRFAGACSIGIIKATRETAAGRSTERRYHVASLPTDSKRFAHGVRTH
ncbi:MAG: hypothetical protein GVY23_03775 [Spirochaetes bacterium]|nr:hypothetical protein [Spirochaetota bacterium]